VNFHFHPEALQEYKDAVRYYMKISNALATAFIIEVEDGIHRILNNPRAWQIVEEDIHRHFINRFPYGLYYYIEDKNSIQIVAVKHMSREAGYWKERINN
jgi:plasmid stabilization system protein ParE